MQYILSFFPWIAYAVVASIVDWRLGVTLAFVAQAALAIAQIRKGRLELLSVGTLVFFGAMTALALISAQSAIHRWIPALSAAALALIAASSLLGEPFTMAIARRNTPETLWSHPEFIRLNRFLTSVWAASFATAAIACALLIDLVKNDAAPVVIANALTLLAAFYITRRTVKRAEARAAAAGLM